MFYEEFLKLCNSVGKSPSAVALENGIAKSTISRWKKGGSPTDATLCRLASYFDVSAGVFLREKVSQDTESTYVESESRSIFARNLCARIENSGETQKEIAQAIGVSPTTVHEWVTGKKYPRIDKIDALADYFGVAVSDLVGKYDVPKGRIVETPENNKYVIFAGIVEKLLKMDADTLATVKEIVDVFDARSKGEAQK